MIYSGMCNIDVGQTWQVSRVQATRAVSLPDVLEEGGRGRERSRGRRKVKVDRQAQSSEDLLQL